MIAFIISGCVGPAEGSFNPTLSFELTDLAKSNKYPSSDSDTTSCADWVLEKAEIELIISQSEPITGPEWHHEFGHWPCQYTGEIKQNGKTYQLGLNAGAWFTLSNGDTTLWFGNYIKEHEAWFLTPALSEEGFK